MKIIEFVLSVKDNEDFYESVEEYLSDTDLYCLVPTQAIIEKDFFVKLLVVWIDKNEEKQGIVVGHNSVIDVIQWFKETHEEVYNLLPQLNVEEFEELVKEMKASSEISLQSVDSCEDFETGFWNEPEPDDFIPKLPTAKESIDNIVKNGFCTRIQCYPETPVGFFVFYGTDFQSLLDHVNKD